MRGGGDRPEVSEDEVVGIQALISGIAFQSEACSQPDLDAENDRGKITEIRSTSLRS